MEAVNPATGEAIDSYEDESWAAVDEALDRATEAFADWSDRPITDREQRIAAVGEVLRDDLQSFAELVTREMGKPITQSRAEIEKCVWACEHYAEYGGSYLQAEQYPSPPGTTAKTVYEPLGPLLAVMPWNFPFWQVFRFAVPYLTAGNVGVLKHASNVPGCARAIEDVFEAAGLPAGVFQSLLVPADLVADIIEDPRIHGATLTGSNEAGKAIASTAGDQLKKTVLELGGSDPFIVLDDADVPAAAEAAAWGRNQNGGQSCIASKRFIVHEAVYHDFLDAFVQATESLTVGDPMDESTDVGPLAREDLMADLHEQVTSSVAAGATVMTGGEPLDRDGAFYPPTVLTEVPAGCPADSEEVFGPVAAVYERPDEGAIVEQANDTKYGLGASVWTEDPERGERLAREIEAGCLFINELVKSDPRVPFGGIKASGYGRELSKAGITEFVNRKTVWNAGAGAVDADRG